VSVLVLLIFGSVVRIHMSKLHHLESFYDTYDLGMDCIALRSKLGAIGIDNPMYCTVQTNPNLPTTST
jgi:hypothetical protein